MINYPSSLDTFTNPLGTDFVISPDHALQHSNVNDGVEALQVKVGVNNSAATTSLDYIARGASRLVVGTALGVAQYTDIQTAVNAGSVNGGEVFVKSGTYTLSDVLLIPANVKIVGENKKTTVITIPNSANFAKFQGNYVIVGLNGDNSGIENITIDGNKSNQSPVDFNFDTLGNYKGIFSYNSNNVIIRDNIVKNTNYNGITIYKGTYGDISDNKLETIDARGIVLSNCFYFDVHNNYLGTVGMLNNEHGISVNGTANSNNVYCNKVEATQGFGIVIEASCNFNKVFSNYTNNTRVEGIAFSGVHNTIANNIVDTTLADFGMSEDGDFGATSYNTIVGNKVLSSYATGFFMNNTSYNTVTDNQFIGCNTNAYQYWGGITLGTSANYNNISNNSIIDTKGTGKTVDYSIIESNACDYNLYTSNICYGYKTAGVGTAGAHSVKANNIESS